MTWNLWLDDERNPFLFLSHEWAKDHPEFQQYLDAGYTCASFYPAKSVQQAIGFVKQLGPPAFMALDHDLGAETTMDFLKWLAENHGSNPPEWKIHSSNPAGSKNIDAFMRSWVKALDLP